MIGIDTPALLEKAHRKTMVGRYEDAIALYDDVLAADPTNIVALENKGKAYYYLGKHEDAIRC